MDLKIQIINEIKKNLPKEKKELLEYFKKELNLNPDEYTKYIDPIFSEESVTRAFNKMSDEEFVSLVASIMLKWVSENVIDDLPKIIAVKMLKEDLIKHFTVITKEDLEDDLNVSENIDKHGTIQ